MFVVLCQVKPHDLVLLLHPHANHPVNDLIDDHGAHKAVSQSDRYGEHLYQELLRVAEKETIRPIWIDELRGEEPCCEGTPDPANTVYAKGVQRIVVPQ